VCETELSRAVKLAAEFRLRLEEDAAKMTSEKANWERERTETTSKVKEVIFHTQSILPLRQTYLCMYRRYQ